MSNFILCDCRVCDKNPSKYGYLSWFCLWGTAIFSTMITSDQFLCFYHEFQWQFFALSTWRTCPSFPPFIFRAIFSNDYFYNFRAKSSVINEFCTTWSNKTFVMMDRLSDQTSVTAVISTKSVCAVTVESCIGCLCLTSMKANKSKFVYRRSWFCVCILLGLSNNLHL